MFLILKNTNIKKIFYYNFKLEFNYLNIIFKIEI